MSRSPGLWQRFLEWAQGKPEERALPRPALVDEPPQPPPVRRARRSNAEVWLDELIAAAAGDRRVDEIGSGEFWTRLDELRGEGHELLALQWLEKFLSAPATPAAVHTDLRLRLVDWLIERRNTAEALPHLQLLSETEEHATRAHYLMAEHHRRAGNEIAALRHYEAVLARDVEYPNVRARVERIRIARGQSAPPSASETLAGLDALGAVGGARYRLLRELGRGATAAVYLARDLELDRDVAVKLLHPHLAAAGQAEACARFFAEARVAASLRHPNIVAILDLDESTRRIVMELAAGGTLSQLLRSRGPRPVRRALERHAQILSALAAAHRHGIVHRDLKPANLMFRRDPDDPGAEVVLGDFGVAHLPDLRPDLPDRDRRPNVAVGTLAYMAPEQRRGHASPRSDVFAAAVVLFQMLTGRTPWLGPALLRGAREVSDFKLDGEITSSWPKELRSKLQDHLFAIGCPDENQRIDTAQALEDARRLRDIAIRFS
jgi:hypothetical protein